MSLTKPNGLFTASAMKRAMKPNGLFNSLKHAPTALDVIKRALEELEEPFNLEDFLLNNGDDSEDDNDDLVEYLEEGDAGDDLDHDEVIEEEGEEEKKPAVASL